MRWCPTCRTMKPIRIDVQILENGARREVLYCEECGSYIEASTMPALPRTEE